MPLCEWVSCKSEVNHICFQGPHRTLFSSYSVKELFDINICWLKFEALTYTSMINSGIGTMLILMCIECSINWLLICNCCSPNCKCCNPSRSMQWTKIMRCKFSMLSSLLFPVVSINININEFCHTQRFHVLLHSWLILCARSNIPFSFCRKYDFACNSACQFVAFWYFWLSLFVSCYVAGNTNRPY